MSEPRRVWYAGYGSNLWWPRFQCYLQGGTPPGSDRPHVGARDPRPPMADAACWLPYRLVFAGESRTWGGGGVAFVDVDVGERCRARRWLITLEQFADVVAQEGGRQPGEDLDLSPALVHGRMTVGASWYDLVVVADEIDGVPVVTLTTSKPLSLGPLAPNPPSAAYAETIVNGLEESHGLTRKEAARYVDLAAAGPD